MPKWSLERHITRRMNQLVKCAVPNLLLSEVQAEGDKGVSQSIVLYWGFRIISRQIGLKGRTQIFFKDSTVKILTRWSPILKFLLYIMPFWSIWDWNWSTNRGDYTVRGNPKMFLFSSRLFSSASCSSLALSWENSHCYELFFFCKVIWIPNHMSVSMLNFSFKAQVSWASIFDF